MTIITLRGITIHLPLDQIIDAHADTLKRAAQVQQDKRRKTVLQPEKTVLQACTKLTNALARYESGQGTRDERRALAGLIAASKGVRTALANLKNPL